MPSSNTLPCTCISRGSTCQPWPIRWIRSPCPAPKTSSARESCKNDEPATLRGGRHHPAIRQSLRRKEQVLVDVAPSPRTARHRVLPHGNTRWPPGPLFPMRPRGHLFQLLPVRALSKVPNQRSRQVAHRAQQRTAAGPLCACRFHLTPRAFVADLTQQKSHLRSVGSPHRRPSAGDCGRPTASRRGDRLPQRAPHLGPDPPASSAHSLRDPLWWSIARSPALGPPSLPFLPARGRTPPRLSWQVRRWLEGRLSARQTRVSGQSPPAGRGECLCRVLVTALD